MVAGRQWRLGAFASGAAWAGVSGGISIILPFVVFILFAQALDPADIGRFALAAVLAELVKAFGLPGLYEAMLQRRDVEERDQAAALGIFLLTGLLLLPVQSGLLLGILSLTSGWPPENQLWLLLLMGLKVPIDLALLQPQAELARRQAYARLAQRNMAANLGSAILGLGALALGFPLLGLAAYTLGFSLATALATIVGTGALRWPCWDPKRLGPLWREARAASAVRGAATANNQLDQLLVGAMLGPIAFAYYNLGKRIETAFLNVSNTFASTLLQPHFAATRPDERGGVMRKALVLLTATVGTVTACFVATADLVVATLLGPAWLPAVPATILLALGGHIRALASVHTSMLSVSGRNGLVFRYLVVTTFISVLLVAVAAPFGATMAAAAVLARVLISGTALTAATRQDVGGSTVRLHLTHALLPFLAMIGVALAARGAVAGTAWASLETTPERALATIVATALAAGAIGLGLLVRQKLPARPVVVPALGA